MSDVISTAEQLIAPEVPGLVMAFERLGEMILAIAPQTDLVESLDRVTAKVERGAAEAALAAKFPDSP